MTTLYVTDVRPAEERIACPVCTAPTRGRTWCDEHRGPIELRFVEVQVRVLLERVTRIQRIPGCVAAQCVEERCRWGGSGSTLEEALAELARATIDARPSWVRKGHSLEVVVRTPGRALSGSGSTIGLAIGEALSRLAYEASHG